MDHPDEADVPAQLHHLVVDRQPLSRGQPRYMLKGIINVISDGRWRAYPLSAEVAVRALWPTVAIQRGARTVLGRSGLIHQRGPHGVHGVVARALVGHGSGSFQGGGGCNL